MSLINGSLQIGQSAIRAHQAALEVVGNNIANASDPNYSRQRPVQVPAVGNALLPGVFSGSGVELTTILRMADQAINARMRSALSDRSSAQASAAVFAQIETIFNALGDDTLATRTREFFNAFTELANDPQSAARRTLVLQSAQALVQTIGYHHRALTDQRLQINSQLATMAEQANRLIDRVAELNKQIISVEMGLVSATAGTLHDQRDAALAELADLMEITTHGGSNGAINVYFGSTPLVQGVNAFGLTVGYDEATGYPDVVLKFSSTNAPADIRSGKIGGLIQSRADGLAEAMAGLDRFALTLVNEVNRLHADGQGLVGFQSLVSASPVSDPTAALNAAGLSLAPSNGTFLIHLTDSSGLRTTRTVEVKLDGIGAQTTLTSLAADIDALDHVSASSGSDGRLTLTAASGYTISFSEDSSGALAALGVNTFFTGGGAVDIAVRRGLTAAQIAASSSHEPADNSNAIRLAGLAESRLSVLDGRTLDEFYRDLVAVLAGRGAEAQTRFEASDILAETLTAQRDAVSGVNLDEEAVDLIRYQRAYQSAAHYISLINQLLGELLQIV